MVRKTKAQQILKDLLKLTPLDEIRATYNNPKSALFTAYTQFFPIADQWVVEKQDEIRELNQQMDETQPELDRLTEQVEQMNDKQKQLQQQYGELLDETEKVKEQLDGFRQQLSALQERGITPHLVARIHRMELESGAALLERVQTASNHLDLQRECDQLTDQKTRLMDALTSLEQEKTTHKADVQNWKNRLDEAQRTTQTFKEAVSTTMSLFAQGYSTQDLKALSKGLGIISIRGKPSLSINRLVSALESANTLVALQNQSQQERATLKSLQDDIAKAKGGLHAHRDIVLDALNTIKDQTVNQIEETKKRAVQEVGEVKATAETHIKNLGQQALRNLNNADVIAKNIVQTLNRETEAAFQRFDKNVTTTTKNHHTQVNTLFQTTRAEITDSLTQLTSLATTIIKSIEDIRDRAARTGDRLRQLEALAPKLRLLADAEGEPSSIFSSMHFICSQFNTWLGKQPRTAYQAIITQNNYLIRELERVRL